MKRRLLLLSVCILTLITIIVGGLQAQQSVLICPLGQGFWSSHPGNWPTTQIMLGSQLYTREELLMILPGGGGDASTQLAVQLTAARLNVANGAEAAAINPTIAQADALLTQFSGRLPYNVPPSSDAGQQMVNLGVILDAYNNATLTPNCVAATPTPAPTSTPVTTTIVLEGVVQAINVNIITVSNINIQLNPSDPILINLQVGDVVRVEGTPTTVNNVLVIISINVVVIVDVNGTPGPTLTPTLTPTLNTAPTATPNGTLTVTTTPNGTPTDTLTTTPDGDDDDDGNSDLPVTIVIEGPVQQINVNIITIYDIDIVIDPSDPVLTVIQIGDVIRVEGNLSDQNATVVVIAVTIIFVNIDVVVNDEGNVWRDDNSCNNPPPDWAPANGWRRRCEGGNNGGDNNGGGNGRGRGRGDNDDDDDD
jgi:hypothetical protein